MRTLQIPWNKGFALKHLLAALGLRDEEDVLPIYMGDDTTDEDAFQVLVKDKPGLGILVSSIVRTLWTCGPVLSVYYHLWRRSRNGAVRMVFYICNSYKK